MITGHYKIMCDYNFWAHHQLWDVVLSLSDEDFSRTETCYGISIHEQVLHTMGAEWLWMARLRGVSPTRKLTPEMLPDREAIRLKWDEVEKELRAYIENIREAQLSEIITYTTTQGEPQRNARWEILAHVFNHSTDHRSRIIAMLAIMDVEIPDIELLSYFRDNKQHRRRIAMDHFHKASSI